MEPNRVKRAWIWFWYNTITRFVLVLVPSYLVIVVPVLQWLGLPGEAIRLIAIALYAGGIFWAMLDNDYSNLERIGRDVNRKPFKHNKLDQWDAR